MNKPTVLTLVGPIPDRSPDPLPRPALALAGAILEAMMGRRPLHQLRPHLDMDAFRALAGHADAATLRRGRVLRLRAQMPTERAVEAWATVAIGGRAVSCVLRLDAERGAWRCTHLTVLTPVGAEAA